MRSTCPRCAIRPAIRPTWRCSMRSARRTTPSLHSCAIARRGSPSASISSRPSAAAGRRTRSARLETYPGHLAADRLYRAERVLILLGGLDHGLPAGELVDHDVILEEDERVEPPAARVGLAVEAEHVEDDVAQTLPLYRALVDLEAAAGDLGEYTVAHAAVEVVDRERLVEQEFPHHVGVVQDRDVGVRAWI